MEYVKTSLAPKRNHITLVTRRWICSYDLLDVFKQTLDWNEELFLVVDLDAFSLRVYIVRNLKC